MQFRELSEIVENSFLQIAADRRVTHLLTDSRNLTVVPGAVFCAISGTSHDGHNFAEKAYRAGIRQFILEKQLALPADCNVLIVSHTVTALQSIAAFHRRQFDYPVIGITGSNGKTIVKEWLSTLLQRHFTVVKSPKSFNSQLGVPLSVFRMAPHHELAVFEAGISCVGEMEKLENVIRPDIGIFTNIGTAHAEGFSDQQQKIREKLKLFTNCKTIIYCKDHHQIDEIISQGSFMNTFSWSLNGSECNLSAKYDHGDLIVTDQQGHTVRYVLKFTDRISIENLMHCLAICHYLGVDPTEINKAIRDIDGVRMRLTLKEAVNGCYVIDDSYNSDLSALEVAVDFLSRQDQREQKTVILSDILQSGISSEELYNEVGNLLVRKGVSRLIGIGKEIRMLEQVKELRSEFFESAEAFLNSQTRFSNEMILVKGARKFELEKIVKSLEQKTHGTSLIVNMEALTHNLNFYRGQLADDTKLMVMVKALAYGGSYEIANLLQYHGVDYLGVAYADEGVKLRENGINLPVMVLNVSQESFELLSKYRLEPEIYSIAQLNSFIKYFNGKQFPPIHVKLETGMNRLGFSEAQLSELIDIIRRQPNLQLAGIFTHLSSADDSEEREFSLGQLALFEKMSNRLRKETGTSPIRHVLNTSGISNYPDHQYDMVRLGIGLYGYDPVNRQYLKVVSTLKTTVSQVRQIRKGESVGYGRSYRAKSDMKIAVIAIGYADGFRRSLSNGKGKVAVDGKLVPVVGNVCMDMTMIEVTGMEISTGDEVIVFGDNPRIEQLAKWLDTIPYEILTNVGDRVRRIFISE